MYFRYGKPNGKKHQVNTIIQVPSTSTHVQWLSDSAVTSHLTNLTSILQNPHPYTGFDKVLVGNGKLFDIHMVGDFVYTTNSIIALKDFFCVPYLKQNLVSIGKLTRYNFCFVEFTPCESSVKDLMLSNLFHKVPMMVISIQFFFYFLFITC